MMTPSELALKTRALETFRRVLKTHELMLKISSLTLYYDGENMTNHGTVKNGDDTSIVAKQALVGYWKDKLELELANLRTHGVDASLEMPKW